MNLINIERGEWPRFLLAFCYFFFLLAGYFMLRPIRGTVSANHADSLHWLYSATFVSMLLIVPVFGWLVSKFRRGRFVPGIYLFFISNLAFFAFAFEGDATGDWIQYSFYVWLSVFNLFVVSIFWSFMADIFQPDQAQRLFGSIMAGGSLGAISGPLLTANWVGNIGSGGVMALAICCLLVATGFAIALGRFERQQHHDKPAKVIGGSIWEGAVRVFQSRYLLLICLLMLSHNLTATFLYNGMAVLVDQNIVGFDERTRFFSYVDLIVQVIAFMFQFLITSRLVIYLGMPRTAILPPILLAAGFTLLGSSLGLVLFAAVQVAQRALNYGLLGPVKEMLFTVVSRETKYKSKNFIDTVVYRGSDVTASWIFKGMMTAGLSIGQVAWIYVPVMLVWGLGAWHLGKAYTRLKSRVE
ncbi:MAG: MFS transporter [Xanthomonadales bacterium]|nr:MFS transporter [Gammaproteobacteria bacterium]MBT8074608.1 MFS transporter [Gammaproteobacteria bacterium]MBT8076362.1 MFS transporter [Gammaproteobacteria bacterium]NNK05460.1 MFS transporter [Xanthomonadales bacterium]NNK98955.1 MFS transporter [Xanthomonadales bacterium]